MVIIVFENHGKWLTANHTSLKVTEFKDGVLGGLVEIPKHFMGHVMGKIMGMSWHPDQGVAKKHLSSRHGSCQH